MPAPSPVVASAAAGSAVGQILQDPQAVAYDGVGGLAFYVTDHPHAAGIVIELGIVEPLCLRRRAKAVDPIWMMSIGHVDRIPFSKVGLHDLLGCLNRNR